jgi:TM2 domain-containing membrane protein YozV
MSQEHLPQQSTRSSPQPGVSGDARAMMMFEANKKSIAVAYLLWLFFGGAGGHRFYAGKTGSAVAQLLLLIFGLILTVVVVGVFVLIGLYIWVLVDAFLIPGWIRNQNSLLAMQLGR